MRRGILATALLTGGCLLDFDAELLASTDARATVSGSGTHTCALDGGVARCWGSNRFGELGRGVAPDDPTRPARITMDDGWASVAAGGNYETHTCGVRNDGSLWCWGTNGDAQLGQHPDALDRSEVPLEVDLGTDIATVDVGTTMTCVLTTDGEPWCWGWNGGGRLGLASDATYPPPSIIDTQQPWRQLSVGETFGCGIRGEARELTCFGSPQPALGRAGGDATPAAVDAEVDGWRYVDAGVSHACGIRSDTSLWCWGANEFGQLGVDTEGEARVGPVRVGNETGWTAVSAGRAHTCGLRGDGTAWCWGDNSEGQLASTGGSSSAPGRVGDETDWAELRAGHDHTCGWRRGEDRLWCWGGNGEGQLGNGNFDSTPMPHAVEFDD